MGAHVPGSEAGMELTFVMAPDFMLHRAFLLTWHSVVRCLISVDGSMALDAFDHVEPVAR